MQLSARHSDSKPTAEKNSHLDNEHLSKWEFWIFAPPAALENVFILEL